MIQDIEPKLNNQYKNIKTKDNDKLQWEKGIVI